MNGQNFRNSRNSRIMQTESLPPENDPVGDMCLVPQDIGYLTGLVLDATAMPLALVLEGGYGPLHGRAVRNIFGAPVSP